MNPAHSLAAVEIVLDGYHPETTSEYMALRSAGFTSISVSYIFPRNILHPDPEDDDAKPDARPRKTIIVGVGDADRDVLFEGEVRQLQAFAVWAESANEVRELALAIGMKNEKWRNYVAKPSHLPMLDAPDDGGRWYVCYAEDDATLPKEIEFVLR